LEVEEQVELVLEYLMHLAYQDLIHYLEELQQQVEEVDNVVQHLVILGQHLQEDPEDLEVEVI
jgi:hypothetical protein